MDDLREEDAEARAALAPRLERAEELDDRFEPALDVFLDLESDAREMDDFVRLGLGRAARLSPRLQATVFRHLAPVAIAAREIGLASELLDRIRTATPDTLFGRGLALWRLGRRAEAEQTLRTAAAYRPNVVDALVAPDLPEPTLTPGRVSLGGEDEAWLYREDMWEVWESTPEALDFLRGLPKPGPVRGRRRSRRPPRER